jgi:hypothetical protein
VTDSVENDGVLPVLEALIDPKRLAVI